MLLQRLEALYSSSLMFHTTMQSAQAIFNIKSCSLHFPSGSSEFSYATTRVDSNLLAIAFLLFLSVAVYPLLLLLLQLAFVCPSLSPVLNSSAAETSCTWHTIS